MLLLLHCLVGFSVASPLPYLDPSLPWDDRVADLVGRLNLTEKSLQLMADDPRANPMNARGANMSQYRYWTECNSGFGQVGYPQNMNMAATFNRSLVFAAGRGTGSLMRANAQGEFNYPNGLSCWSPMMVSE
jgi:beta-glucosidase